MNIVIFIPIQLFFILLFSKTFVRCDELPNEIKIAIRWSNFATKKKNLFKLAANEDKSWNERFELNLFRVDPQTGRVIEPPIASGITGHYDFAVLKIYPLPQQIGTQNIVDTGTGEREEVVRRRKGKEIVGEKSAQNTKNSKEQDGDEFELQISIVGNWNFQQTITKRLKKLPDEWEILICPLNSHSCIYDVYNEKDILQPKRRIFFQMNLRDENKLKLISIKCIKRKYYIIPLEPAADGNGVKYFGPVCPSDEYILNFLVDGHRVSIPYNCDEAIYVNEENIYQFKNHPDGKLECRLLLRLKNNEDGKSQELANVQMKQLEKGNSSSNPSMTQPAANFPNESSMNLPTASEWEKRMRFKIGKLMKLPQEDKFNQKFPIQVPQHQFQPISPIPHQQMIQDATQLLHSAFSSTGPSQNHPKFKHSQADPHPQSHLPESSTIHRCAVDNNNTDNEWKEVPILVRRKNPKSTEKSEQPESTSMHGLPDPPVNLELSLDLSSSNNPINLPEIQYPQKLVNLFTETHQQNDYSSSQRHDTGQIQPSRMSLPHDQINQGNSKAIPKSLQIPQQTTEKQIGSFQSQRSAFKKYAAKHQSSAFTTVQQEQPNLAEMSLSHEHNVQGNIHQHHSIWEKPSLKRKSPSMNDPFIDLEFHLGSSSRDPSQQKKGRMSEKGKEQMLASEPETTFTHHGQQSPDLGLHLGLRPAALDSSNLPPSNNPRKKPSTSLTIQIPPHNPLELDLANDEQEEEHAKHGGHRKRGPNKRDGEQNKAERIKS